MVIVTVDGAVDVTSGGHPGPVRVEAMLRHTTVGDNFCRRRRDWPSRPLPLTGLTPTLSRVPRGRGRWSTRCREGRHEGGRAEARWCRRGKSRPEQAGSLGHGQGGVVGRAEGGATGGGTIRGRTGCGAAWGGGRARLGNSVGTPVAFADGGRAEEGQGVGGLGTPVAFANGGRAGRTEHFKIGVRVYAPKIFCVQSTSGRHM